MYSGNGRRLRFRLLWRGNLLFGLGWAMAIWSARPAPVAAQEPTGLQAAVALEKALIDTIAKNKKSVVAIARVAKADSADLGTSVNELGQIVLPENKPKPGDSEFIPNGYGSGVIIGKQGLILTAYHVISEGGDFFVTTADRRTYPAKVKAADARSDLAVLEIAANDLTPVTLGEGDKLVAGQIVISLGNPYAIARDGQPSASWGIVSNLERKSVVKSSDGSRAVKEKLYNFGTLIQTDAKLNLGTSGGALLNLHGEMIGLTTSLAATSGYEQSAGYAIAADDTFRRIVETLKLGREVEYGFLGISPANLKDHERLAGLRGTRVEDVVPGTPAKRCGLEAGDIITHVNGQAVNDADGLVLQVGKLPIDSAVKLNVLRGDTQKLQITAELIKLPVPGKKIVTTPAAAWRGMRVDYWTMSAEFQRQRLYFSDIDPDGCVVITDVEKGSPADAAKLKPEMFITRVGNTPVRSPREFQAAVHGKTDSIELQTRSNSESQRITIKGG